MANTKGESAVNSVANVFDIIEIVGEHEIATLTELAADLDMPRSTLHGYLSTMVDKQYLVKDGGSYQLGLKFLEQGRLVQLSSKVYQTSEPFLNQVADQTNEIAWLVVEEYGKAVFLRKAEGELAVKYPSRLGKRFHMHCIASGKAILANLPEDRVENIITTHGLPQFTEQTITDVSQLYEELEGVRETGVAFNDEELMEGFRAVASPINTNSEVKGAIMVSGPKNRLRDDKFREELPKIISGTTNALELELSS